jgi:membrane associated rhomboid family serine protease
VVEVFASRSAAACRERALVLRAQGIPYSQVQSGGMSLLLVDEEHAEAALAELASYERENRDWPPRDHLPAPLPGGALGLVGFFVLVGGAHLVASTGAFGIDWRELGASRSAAVLGGEPWRVVTALFLHSGPVHVLSNLVFGALFGYSLSYAHGGGLAWLAILVAGALGNLTNAWIQGPEFASIGASTAIFGAVGLLGGSEWRRRKLLRQRRLRVAAPVVMALLLLAFHGVPQEIRNVDVLAHVTGCLWGLVLGATLPFLVSRGLGSRRGQIGSAILALLVVGLAWTLALSFA